MADQNMIRLRFNTVIVVKLKVKRFISPSKVSSDKSHLEVHHHIYEEFIHLFDSYKAWYYSYTSNCCKGTGAQGSNCKPRKADELPSTHCAEYKHHFMDLHLMLQKLKSEEKFADDYLKKKMEAKEDEEEEKKNYLTLLPKHQSKISKKGKEYKVKKLLPNIQLPNLEGLSLKAFIDKYEKSFPDK